MASEINRAYHAQLRKAQYKLIGHAIKSNSEQAMRNRDPDYLGTVINPVNAGPRVFFWTKDEARVPWSSLINVGFENRKFAGAGVEPSVTGAMATPAGRAYAKKQLERKALDLEMIRSMIPMPVEGMAQAAAQMDDVQRRQLEVSLMLRQATDALEDGSADSSTVENLRKAIPPLVDLVPNLTSPQMNELIGLVEDGITIGRSVPDAKVYSQTFVKARNVLTVLFRKIASFLSSNMNYSGDNIESRRNIARNTASSVFKEDKLEDRYATEDVPADGGDEELIGEQLADEDTAPVIRPPVRRRAAPASSAAAAAEPSPQRFLAWSRSRDSTKNNIISQAFDRLYDEVIGMEDKKIAKAILPADYLRRGKDTAGRNYRSFGPTIANYIERFGRYPTEELADAVQAFRGRV